MLICNRFIFCANVLNMFNRNLNELIQFLSNFMFKIMASHRPKKVSKRAQIRKPRTYKKSFAFQFLNFMNLSSIFLENSSEDSSH